MDAAPALNLAETLTISVGESRKETNWKPKTITWSQMVERLRNVKDTGETLEEFYAMTRDQQQDIKDVGGYVGGTIEGGRTSDNVTDRDILTLDADYADLTLKDNWDLMVGKAAVIHSTHKHTPENPRQRIVAPLKRAVTPLEYEAIARRVASWLDIECFDDTTYEPNRLMFWPSKPTDGEYIFEVFEGNWLDPDEILATYKDWHDMSEWPVSEREEQKIVHKSADKAENPLKKPGIIGAFNRVHSITDAIVTYLPEVYRYEGGNRWTYAKGSTFAGAVTYEDDTFLYSHHDTDPVSKRLCNAFDLVRLHLFGDRDNGVEGDIQNMPSQLAMRELCKKDEAVVAEFAASIHADPTEVFRTENDDLKRFIGDTTPLGSAVQFIDTYGHKFRYCSEFDWMYWDGQRWKTDAAPEIGMLAMRFADNKFSTAKILEGTATDKYSKEVAKEAMKQANKLRTTAGQKDMLTQAGIIQNDPDPNSYDANPWDLNTPDGILDMRTGEIRPHDPDAKCTKITSCGLNTTPEAVEKWADFIKYITCGDVEFAEYLQMLMGMASVGKVYEEGIIISYGPGGNGKSTFFGAVSKVLGDYAKSLNADTVTPINGKPDENYIVMLKGVRLGIMGETDENAKLAVAGMKRITSQDEIIARKAYHGDPLQFESTSTLVMHTNHLPRLNSLDGGTKRRLAVAPFPATLPPEEIITDYKSVLVNECGGAILQWIVEGARKFYAAGCKLQKPAVVQKATDEYIHDEDTVQQFIEDECTVGKDLTVPAKLLFDRYEDWAQTSGFAPKSKNSFGRVLTDKGFTRGRDYKKRTWEGLALNAFINTDDGTL